MWLHCYCCVVVVDIVVDVVVDVVVDINVDVVVLVLDVVVVNDVYVVAFIAIFTLPNFQLFAICFVNLDHGSRWGIRAWICLNTKEACV